MKRLYYLLTFFCCTVFVLPTAFGQTPTNGLAVYYPFDGNANDMSGSGNHGTVHGATLTTDRFGREGKAYNFSSGNWIKIAQNAAFQFDNFSISVWFYYGGAGTSTSIIGNPANSPNEDTWLLGFDPSNKLSGYIYSGNYTYSPSPVAQNTWQLATFVKNGTTAKLYLNGQVVHTITVSQTINYSTARGIIIGGDDDAGEDGNADNLFYNGKLDEIRIYNRALSDTEVAAMYSYENVGLENVNPMINYSSGTINRFSNSSQLTLTVNGKNFTPNTTATLTINCPNTSRNFDVTVGSIAQFTYPITVNSTYPEGTCTISVKDASGKTSQIPLLFTILPAISSYDNYLKINNTNTTLAAQWSVGWSDLMFKATQYGNTALRNYRYLVEYGLQNGSGQVNIWYTAGYFPANVNGTAVLGENQNFTLNFNPLQATTTGNYVIRVTDYLINTRKTTSQPFAFNPATAVVNNVNFVWDYTSGNRTNLVEGVAADSTSRFYIKVTPPSNVSGVVRAEAQIKDPDFPTNTETRVLGKLMRATVINQFSPEANTANAILVSNNQPVGLDYWFWYVAPNDFARSSVLDYNAEERKVELTVRFYNSINALVATSVKQIRIARPPLMLVHGLGGDRSTWNGFKHDGKLFVTDGAFKICKAVQMYGDRSFDANSRVLLGFDTNKYENSFDNILQQMRNLGFAANRVDYIAHSMGGSMLRNTLHVPQFKQDYYNIYKNYGRGFVNKFITLDTPHWGSPLGDIVTEFAPYMNGNSWPVSTLNSIASEQLSAFMNFQYEKYNEIVNPPAGSPFTTPNARLLGIRATDAVRDLSYRNGVRFSSISINNHVVVGDYVRKFSIFPEYALVKSYWGVTQSDMSGIGLPILAEFLSDGAMKKFSECNCKSQWIYLLGMKALNLSLVQNTIALGGESFAYKFMNWQSNRVYPAGETFFQNSDMIVSVESQANGQIRKGTNGLPSNVSVYEAVNHNFEPDKVVDNGTVGNRVYELLNTSLHNIVFAKTMNAAPKITSTYNCELNCNLAINNVTTTSLSKTVAQNTGQSTKIRINQPVSGTSIAALSELNTQISVLDTAKLFYVETRFQDVRMINSNKEQSLNYKLQADGRLLGWQRIIASAVYKINDSTFTTHSDTSWVNITTVVPLSSISANREVYRMMVGNKQFVDLTAYYETFSSAISFTNPSLNITIQDPSVIEYNSSTGTFTAKKAGVTSATATFNGKQTDILFYVECGNNLYSVKSGNWNDPTTWSCARVPLASDNVTIKAGHRVNLSVGEVGQCRNLTTEHTAFFDCPKGAVFLANPNQ